MGFNSVAKVLTLSAVLAAGQAVAQETDAERCAGYPGFDGATESFEDFGRNLDELNAYRAQRFEHHREQGESNLGAIWAVTKDVSYCSGLTEKAQELREKGEELLDDVLPEKKEAPPLGEPV